MTRLPRIGEESGQTLVLGLVVMMVLLTLSIAIGTESIGNTNQTARSLGSVKALQVAQAGENNERSVLFNQFSLPTFTFFPATGNLTSIPAPSGGLPGTSALAYAAASVPGTVLGTYTVSGTGSGTTAQAEAAISKTSSSKINVLIGTPDLVTTMTYFDPSSGCLSLPNNGTFSQTLYVDGNFCLSNNTQIDGGVSRSGTLATGSPTVTNLAQTSDLSVGVPVTGAGIPAGTTIASIGSSTSVTLSQNATSSGAGTLNFLTTKLYVNGSLTVANSGAVGTAALPLAELHVKNGCGGHVCGPADHVYALTSDTTVSPLLTKPPVDWTAEYQNTAPGPLHNCTSGTFPAGFDVDTNVNDDALRDVTGQMFGNTDYDCKYQVGTNLIGELKWSHTTNTLTVAGASYIDGSVAGLNRSIVVAGKGTIFFSGNFVIGSSTTICAGTGGACDNTWDPSTNLLVIATRQDFTLQQHSQYQGNVYTDDYSLANNSDNWGTVISSDGSLQGNSRTRLTGGTAPFLSPGTHAILQNVPGSWKQGCVSGSCS